MPIKKNIKKSKKSVRKSVRKTVRKIKKNLMNKKSIKGGKGPNNQESTYINVDIHADVPPVNPPDSVMPAQPINRNTVVVNPLPNQVTNSGVYLNQPDLIPALQNMTLSFNDFPVTKSVETSPGRPRRAAPPIPPPKIPNVKGNP